MGLLIRHEFYVLTCHDTLHMHSSLIYIGTPETCGVFLKLATSLAFMKGCGSSLFLFFFILRSLMALGKFVWPELHALIRTFMFSMLKLTTTNHS